MLAPPGGRRRVQARRRGAGPDPYAPAVPRPRAAVQLSRQEARWLTLEAQGLAGRRRHTTGATGPGATATSPTRRGSADARRLRQVMDQVGTIQLDAVNVLARTQLLIPFSRVGHYDPAALAGLSRPGGPWFEYWGHQASLLPVELHPLLRWRMARSRADSLGGPADGERQRAWRAAHRDYLAAVLAEVTERGPVAASALSDPRRRTGEWWDRRSIGREALELLFADGVLAAWRTPSFERVYDLAERVLPAAVLAQPTPEPEAAQRELLAVAAGALGVATLPDLADYFSLRPATARPRVAELVEAGRLVEACVEGWGQPAYLPAGVGRARRPRGATVTLLSPFDSLIWFRDRALRLFDFHYRIEIYVPAAKRVHGYYVLPVLVGDRLVARVDLKADRPAGVLRVAAAWAEAGCDRAATVRPLVAALDELRCWLGLTDLDLRAGGDFPLLG